VAPASDKNSREAIV